MICPNCSSELIVVERKKIELDYCLDCHGFWFDNREWDLLCKRLALRNGVPIGDLYTIPKLNCTKDSTKKCPVCNAKMDKFLAYNIILDRCPHKHGVWFDDGELSRLFNSSLSTSYTNTPINFLGEVFYRKE